MSGCAFIPEANGAAGGSGGGTVDTDGVTIGGDGSGGSPITAIFAGFDENVAVATDGVTITGDGKTATPLAVIPSGLNEQVTVAVDGVTITGDGTTANPLVVVAAPATVVSDGITISGDGSGGSPLAVIPGGLDEQVEVAVDGMSVTGDGTTANPLVAAPQANSIIANVSTTNVEASFISYAIAANELNAGTTFRILLFMDTASLGLGSVTFRVRIGPVTLTGTIAVMLVSTPTPILEDCVVEALVTIRSTGAGGTVMAGVAQHRGALQGSFVQMGAAPAAVNTTIANILELTVAASVASTTLFTAIASIHKIRM